MTVFWRYADNILVILWQYFDATLVSIWIAGFFFFPRAVARDPRFYCILQSDSQQQIGGAATTNKILTIQENTLEHYLLQAKTNFILTIKEKTLENYL